MKKVGIDDISHFDFLDHPDRGSINQALTTLTALGALDADGQITEIGEWLVEFAIEPPLGRMLIESLRPDIDCPNEISVIGSFLNGKNVFVRPPEKELELAADRAHDQFIKNGDSDFSVLLHVWNAYVDSGYSTDWAKENYLNEKVLEEAKNVRLDILDVLAGHGIHVDPDEKPKFKKDAINRSLTAGLIGNLMKKVDRFGYSKVDGTKKEISIHPSSVFYHNPPQAGSFIVAGEIFINPEGKTYACNCLEVKKEWLKEYAPDVFYNYTLKHKDRHHQSANSSRKSYRKSRHNR